MLIQYLIKYKKQCILYFLSIIVITILFGIIINYITNLNLGFNISKNSIWISFNVTIFAAVLGGIISGGLTLIGVIQTIKAQDRKERRAILPSKIMISERLYDEVVKIKQFYEEYNKLDLNNIYFPKGTFVRLKKETGIYVLERLSYLENAAQVSVEFYDEVYYFFEKIEEISNILGAHSHEIYTEEGLDPHDFLGYDRRYYDEIKGINEVMKYIIGFLHTEMMNLRKEYIDLKV